MQYSCEKCGKVREGYGVLEFGIMNGRYYCHEHLPEWRYVMRQRESCSIYYKSFAEILEKRKNRIRDYVREYNEYDPLGPGWTIYSKNGETWYDSGMKFHNKRSAYPVAVVYGELPDEIKDMEVSEGNETTWEVADPDLKFVCGNCRNARYGSMHEKNKGKDAWIRCCIYKEKQITPETHACIDLNNESSVFNSNFNPVGKGGYASAWEHNDPESIIGERLIP